MKTKFFLVAVAILIITACGSNNSANEAPSEAEMNEMIEDMSGIENAEQEIEQGLNDVKEEVDELNNEIDSLLNDL